MIYRIEGRINDGLAEAPAFDHEVDHPYDLDHINVLGELCNDYDIPFGVGATLTITRIA